MKAQKYRGDQQKTDNDLSNSGNYLSLLFGIEKTGLFIYLNYKMAYIE